MALGTDTVKDQLVEPDGRRARRDRGRRAVVDALLGLLQEDCHSPTVDQVAERAGVSVSSVFRYFEGLDDLHHETIIGHLERTAPLFEVPDVGQGPLDQRITTLVDARLALYEAIAPVARQARARALDAPQIADTLAIIRAGFVTQLRSHFDAELAALTPARADDLVVVVDALTAFEAWDLMATTHARSRPQIRRAWASALHTLLDP